MKLASETPSQEWCGKALLLFGNPLLDADTKQAVLEAMRNHECSASNLPQPNSS
jgi:hypothetical protein